MKLREEEFYEQYHQHGGTTIIPTEIFNELYDDATEEIERLNNNIKELLKENENKEKVIIAQDNIIKEVREYIEYQLENLDFEEDAKAKMLGSMVLVLLDKENNNEDN